MAINLTGAAATITAIGAIGGGALTLDHLHTPRAEFDAYVSGNRVQTILSLAEQSRSEGAPAYLCRALVAEFAALCTEMPDHYFCADPEARNEIMTKAGCE